MLQLICQKEDETMDYERKLKRVIDECIDDASNPSSVKDEDITPDFFLVWAKENIEEFKGREEIEDTEAFINYAKEKTEEIKEYLRLAKEKWDEGWGNYMYYQGLGDD